MTSPSTGRPDGHPADLRMGTLAVHGGRRPSATDPDVSPPLRRTSTFLQHPGTHAATDGGDWQSPLVYTRYKNPNVEDVEARLAALEGTEGAVVFASGMAAIHAMFLHAFPGGSGKVAIAQQVYGGTVALFGGVLDQLGVEWLPFDMGDAEDLDRVLREGATLVHVEGISNPVVQVADLPRIVRQAHAAGARVSVDSTFATPIVQRPAVFGVDYVVHSATKALGGHSDITAGAVLGAAPEMAQIAKYRKVTGAVLDPAAAWLLSRSLSTVDLRVKAQCRGALALAEALVAAPGVARVHYSGLPDHPSHALAKEMLAPGLFGSVLAFELEAGDAETRPYASRLRLAIDAPSLGGVETLVSLPLHMSHVMMTDAERRAAGIGPGCVRVACGIEDPADLVADFLQALPG